MSPNAFPKEADTLTAHHVGVIPDAPPTDEDMQDDGAEDDVTTASVSGFSRSEDPTSPTLSLLGGNSAAREAYLRFLSADHARALELASDLIAQGNEDPVLATIVGECRSSLAARQLELTAETTLGEVAAATGLPLERVIEAIRDLAKGG